MRKEFAKYFLIGLSAVVLDMGTLFSFKEFLGLAPVAAVILNQALMVNYVFLLNKRWAFAAGGAAGKQAVKFYILSVFNYFFSVAWMFVWNHLFGANYLMVRIANIILSVSWNFLLYKSWVFGAERADETPDA